MNGDANGLTQKELLIRILDRLDRLDEKLDGKADVAELHALAARFDSRIGMIEVQGSPHVQKLEAKVDKIDGQLRQFEGLNPIQVIKDFRDIETTVTKLIDDANTGAGVRGLWWKLIGPVGLVVGVITFLASHYSG